MEAVEQLTIEQLVSEAGFAVLAGNRSVDRVLLISGDTDMVPAMKHARKHGLEVIVAAIPTSPRHVHDELRAHSDVVRETGWP